MRSIAIGPLWGINPSPEEIVISSWVDETDPYVSLREPPQRVPHKPVRPAAIQRAATAGPHAG